MIKEYRFLKIQYASYNIKSMPNRKSASFQEYRQ